MKKFFALIIALITVTIFAQVMAASYVGNANSKKFHYADCTYAGKMNPANRVAFNTRDEAVNSGYVPCKRCNP